MSPKTVDPSSTPSGSAKLTPREKGCFQCSRRRIICDKGEPTCGKCIKKGIECSGPNRIRFTEGVARRGRLKDCKVPDTRSDGGTYLPMKTAFLELKWQDERKRGRKLKRDVQTRRGTTEAAEERRNERLEDDGGFSASMSLDGFEVPNQQTQKRCEFEGTHTKSPILMLPMSTQHSVQVEVASSSPQSWPTQDATSDGEEDVEEIARIEDSLIHCYSTYQGIQPWVSPLSAETRMLFSYFSEAVAPAMVVFDTVSNGYRGVVLPMAHEDEVLRRAVGVVAAQHLSRERPEVKDAAEAGRTAIISRLRKDSLSTPADQVFNKFTWATLIVLLVGETVTGSTDYSFLVRMLLCLSANSRVGDEDFLVTRFLQTQTNMFELLGIPLLGEQNGVIAITKSFQSWQDWLSCEKFPVGSDNQRLLDEIRQCFAAACSIYIQRATSDDTATLPPLLSGDIALQQSTTHDLMERMSQIPPNAPGAHALVWPCFVAGAEASDPYQRAFFVDYMNSIYMRTKFRNIPVAIQSLENLWAKKGRKRWTQCLPELSNVLVM